MLSDSLLRWIIGVTVGLAVLHGILVLIWGRGEVIAVLPWFVPATHSFLALAALSVAFLAFGRYPVLREPAAFWIGMAFGAFALLDLFYILSWPGLLPGGRGVISQLSNTATWLSDLMHSALVLFLLAAALIPWPRAGKRGERWWFWLMVAGMAIIALIGGLSVTFEQSLPLLVYDGTFTSLNTGWVIAFLAVAAAGAPLSAYRYRQTGESLLGYVALIQVVIVFSYIEVLIGGKRYDQWWYLQRGLWIAAFSAMLFGLLFEYVGLYRREEEERNRLQVLIDTTPVGIILYSAREGPRPVLFNRAAEAILGRPLLPEAGIAEVAAHYGICRPTGEPFPPEELPLSRSLRGETCTGVEMLIRQPSGRGVHILTNSTPLRDAEGRIVGAVLAFQDITAIKEQERLRDEFISAAAHELKTPVTTIKGYAQLMGQWAPQGHEPREGKAIQAINAQADRISRRVQEMLEVVRLRAAPPELRRVRFDLGELAGEVVQRVQVTTEVHRLVLERKAPAPVDADRERIEEVLVSLVDNAIKYSPKGGEIQVRVWAQEGEAMVSVMDHGVGIRRDRQPHIFEPFYEAVPAGAPGYRGIVALSLYLSKLTVERHKGRIWFESEEGKGSTFYVSLPLAKGNDGRQG